MINLLRETKIVRVFEEIHAKRKTANAKKFFGKVFRVISLIRIAVDVLFSSSYGAETVATVIIDHSYGLHERIADRRAHEFKATLLQIPAQGV